MTQLVRIRQLNADGSAQVILIRQSACSGDCHKCSGCGAAQETLIFTAKNPIGAQPGDFVNVEAESGPVLRAAAVMYMLPLVLFFAGYLLGSLWNMGALVGCLCFALSILLAVVYDRKIVKKRETEYTITGYAGHGHG